MRAIRIFALLLLGLAIGLALSDGVQPAPADLAPLLSAD